MVEDLQTTDLGLKLDRPDDIRFRAVIHPAFAN
jgi:hypothetical protein